MEITVKYSSIDRCYKSAKFKTLAGAQRFAQKYLGETPEMGSSYAVSGDGVGKVTVSGCPLIELFPALKSYRDDNPYEYRQSEDDFNF